MRRRMLGLAAAALACVVMLPGVVQAQSAIVGVAKDTSGAVLPGVTVEAASDALIEKTRSVVTDGSGQYRIVDLRPGRTASRSRSKGSSPSSATRWNCLRSSR